MFKSHLLSLLLFLLTINSTESKQILNDTNPEMAHFFLDIFVDLIPYNQTFLPNDELFNDDVLASGTFYFIIGAVFMYLCLAVPLVIGCCGMRSRMGMIPFCDAPESCQCGTISVVFVLLGGVGVAIFYSIVSNYYLYEIEMNGFSGWIAATVEGGMNESEAVFVTGMDLDFDMNTTLAPVSEFVDFMAVFANQTAKLNQVFYIEQAERYAGFLAGYIVLFVFAFVMLVSIVSYRKGLVKLITLFSLASIGILYLQVGILYPFVMYTAHFCNDTEVAVQAMIPDTFSQEAFDYFIHCQDETLSPFFLLQTAAIDELAKNRTDHTRLNLLLDMIQNVGCNGSYVIPFQGLYPEVMHFNTSLNKLYHYETHVLCTLLPNNLGLILVQVLALTLGYLIIFIFGCIPFPLTARGILTRV